MADNNPLNEQANVLTPSSDAQQGVYKLVEPQAAANNELLYNLPINSADVVGVELVDLDLVIITANGERYQTLSFNYGDYKTLAETSGVNQFYLSAKGSSYDIEGNDSANTLRAGYGHDIVRGLGGNDQLYGDQGDDTLIGGTGSDTLDGGSGNNTASYDGSSAAVKIYLDEANANSGGDADGDKLISIQNLSHRQTAVDQFQIVQSGRQ